ncbi:MAG TPA: tRNA methyltransferase [Desulfobulbaceae bacterium]|nr:tRNA methyltransferase [Desulfobulbaceae bacterium]
MSENRQPNCLLPGTAIILIHPRYPENIGASARIALNFGISQLVVVTDEQPEEERMLKMATHKAAHLIHDMILCGDAAEAAASYQFVVGTTARQGRQRIPERTPREVMIDLAPLVGGNRVALMFGPENTGLTNSELDLCQFTSTIPTADFSSLNLAQAVAIHCYELTMAIRHPSSPQVRETDFANSHQLEGMYRHIEEVLTATSYLADYNRTYWMRSIRQFLGRVRISKKEASMIRGVCRKFLWHNANAAKGEEKDNFNQD